MQAVKALTNARGSDLASARAERHMPLAVKTVCSVYDESPESIMACTRGSAPEGIMSLSSSPRTSAAEILAKLNTSLGGGCAGFQPPPPPPADTPVVRRKRKASAGAPSPAHAASVAASKAAKAAAAEATAPRTSPEAPASKKLVVEGGTQKNNMAMAAVPLDGLTTISGYDMFNGYREASRHVFGVDLANWFRDVQLPYCAEEKCALIPTELRMRPKRLPSSTLMGGGRRNKVGTSARLWIAVQRRVAKDTRKRLATRPALLTSR